MASGATHDKITKLLSLPFGIVIAMCLGQEAGLISGISFLIGGLWLSPDLDTTSNAFKRWGPLKWIWKPYKKLLSHRSFLSHAPIIGTTLRLLYLAIWSSLTIMLLIKLSIVHNNFTLGEISKNIYLHKERYLACIVGIEISAWLHLLLDGDPNLIRLKK